MSLRDQLLKAGLASKKDRQRAERDLKKKRKRDQGSAKKKREREAAAAEKERRELEARQQAAREARERHAEEREAHEHVYRVRQILLAHKFGARGKHAFHFRDGEVVKTLWMHRRTAEQLRRGEAAIGRVEPGHYVVIGTRGADKLLEIEPGAVLHYVRTTKGLNRADQRLTPEDPEWALPDLRARRARPDDIERFREAARQAR